MAETIDPARGQRIRARREQLGLTREEVVTSPIDSRQRTVGATPAELAEWEAGADPGIPRLVRLAAGLKTSWRYLATGQEDTGTRIAQLRFERGLSQADLARAVGVGTQGPSNSRTVQAWEREHGARIDDDRLEMIAATLGTTKRYLRSGEPGEDPPEDQRAAENPMRPATRGALTGLREEHGQALEQMARRIGKLERRVRSLERSATPEQSQQAPRAKRSQ